MYIIIVGAGGIGKRLTELSLSEGKHNIIVIDKDQERCEEIARKYDAIAINADATQEEALDEAEISKANVLVTTTRDDAVNLMIVSLATAFHSVLTYRSIFGGPNGEFQFYLLL